MSAFDLVIRNARIPAPEGWTATDIGICGEFLSAIAPGLEAGATEIDADGCMAVPGFFDAHVHFNEPGRADWEGLETGSAALALGGGTAFADMPLNSHPPVLDADRLNEKRRVAEQKSVLDFALWGGLCPGHIDAIPAMADAGAIGFKAFLCDSGIAEFPSANAATLHAGMRAAAACGKLVGVHAEDPAHLLVPLGSTARDFAASRPIDAEVSAIRMACEIAGETGCALQVVHVSSAHGLDIIREARAAGVDVTAETCPHYLLFTDADMERLGARAKCAPPLRSPDEREALWNALHEIDTIGSDHSPAPPDRKVGPDFRSIWGGIAGCQHAFPAFLDALNQRDPSRLTEGVERLTTRPAARFGIGDRKGRLAIGCDADVTLLRFGEASTITSSELRTRHPMSIYEGFSLSCMVRDVIRRGEAIVRAGNLVTGTTRGRFLRGNRNKRG